MTDRGVAAEPRKEFWEKMAERYPRPFDEEQLAHTRGIIAVAEGMGVTLDGAALLDVGCGTGVYALPLAARAARVVGLDISEEMTRRFEAERAEQGITNATAICSPWGDAAVAEHGLERAFDVVWVAMLPTIRSRADVSRLSRCSRGSCVYVGWNGSRTNPFLEAIFRAHGQPFGPPPGAREVQAALTELGLRSEIHSTVRSWEWDESPAEAAAYAHRFLSAHSVADPRHAVIQDIVAGFVKDGKVRQHAEVSEAVVVWEVGP